MKTASSCETYIDRRPSGLYKLLFFTSRDIDMLLESSFGAVEVIGYSGIGGDVGSISDRIDLMVTPYQSAKGESISVASLMNQGPK